MRTAIRCTRRFLRQAARLWRKNFEVEIFQNFSRNRCMKKSFRILIVIALLLVAGSLALNFWADRSATLPAMSENDLARVAAKAGNQVFTNDTVSARLDFSHPVKLAIGGLGLADAKTNQLTSDLVMADLSHANGFQLVEGSVLNTALVELNLSLNDFVRAEQAIRVGKSLTVDWVLFGTPTILHGTNFIVARLVDAHSGATLDTDIFPLMETTALAAELAKFVRQSRQSAAEGRAHIYLAVGSLEDLSVNNRRADFPAQLRGYLKDAYRHSKVTLLEREYVDALSQEERLDLAGLTQDNGQPHAPMQAAFWLIDGAYS
jgi:TolB-like protein